MPDNLTVTIGADSTKLRADLALAQASLRQFARELKTAADAARQTGETTQLQAASARYEATAQRVRSLGAEMKSATAAHAAAMPLVAALGERFTLLGGKLREVGSRTREAGRTFREMGDRTVPGLGAALASLSIAEVTRRLTELTQQSAEAVIQVHELGETFGASAVQVQAMQLAAAQTGRPIDSLTGTLARLNRQIGEARLAFAGKFDRTLVIDYGAGIIKPEAELKGFERLGIGLAKYKGTFEGAQQLIRDTVAALEKIPNVAERDATAFEALGKTWVEAQRDLRSQEGAIAAQKLLEKFDLAIQPAEEKAAAAFIRARATLEGVATRTIQLVSNIVGQALIPFFDQLTRLIGSNRDAIIGWANSFQKDLAAVGRDIGKLFTQGLGAKFETQTVTQAVTVFRSLGEAGRIVSEGLKGLIDILDGVARALNSVFGTQLTGQGLAIVAVIGTVSGAFTALAAAIGLVTTAAGFFLGTALGAALLALSLIALDIYKNWEPIKGLFVSIWETWVEISNWISNTFLAVIDSLVQKATSAITAVGNFLGLSGTETGATGSATGATGLAAGGYVSGPGTGISDSVPARLSAGEYVVNAASVRALGVGLLHRLNNFAAGGLVGAPPIGFAAGGLVAAGSSSGRPVHLHLGSQSYALQGSESVVDALVSHAYSQNMRSAGVKPTWFGGRPGGG